MKMTKGWIMSLAAVVFGGLLTAAILRWYDNRKTTTKAATVASTAPTTQKSIEQILAEEGF